MILVKLAIAAIYIGGVWLFWRGFPKTFWSEGFFNRLMFSVFWPVWLITKTGRRNLGRALKG
ncbi:MAG: hypothetical protein NZ772_10290 [Cyanobacteria bacterium]|nr:hypothetical protein [Cyanobacteriota bacterium]MDW8202045.1 hypothetical protein [Cyanobacteriota bacterium SKYGB_h_bin112]